MNKSDLKLIGILIIFFILIFIGFKIFEKKGSKQAIVYYEDKIVLRIDLDINSKYEVDGYNGKVKLEVKDGKIRVLEENSPIHLCSKQGYISKSYETIVCLPNKITIKIDSTDFIDTKVG